MWTVVIFVSGYWRILDFQFLSLVLSHIIQLCDENDWIKAGIPYQECMETLVELFPRYDISTTCWLTDGSIKN